MITFKVSKVLPLLVSLCAVGTFSEDVSPTIALTRNGPLQGFIKDSREGTSYVAFLGLRYAEPPERFEPPQPLKRTWTEPRLANTPGQRCAQIEENGDFVDTEDCLFLHVYVPKNVLEDATSSSKLPVMVWIHGGGFGFGDGANYGPDYFMDDGDVVLVTLNYRLGIFGFLSFDNDAITSNNGLRDQVMALRWIQENIGAFQGDPSQVTVFGNSAGSASVHYLLMSPLAEGLFHRAIMQSGAFSFWSYTQDPRDATLKVAEALKCSPKASSDKLMATQIKKCLKKKEMKKIHLAEWLFWMRWPQANKVPRFLPTAGEGSSNQSFFSRAPGSLYDGATSPSKYVNKVPVMIGVTKDEGSTVYASFVLSSDKDTEEMEELWEEAVAAKGLFLETHFPEKKHPGIAGLIRKFYFGSEEISIETKEEVANMYSDSMFFMPVMLAAEEMAKEGFTVYPYIFNYYGGWSIRNGAQLFDFPGMIGHADELQYMFPHPSLGPPLKPGSEQEEFSRAFVKSWKTFAKEGKPPSEWNADKALDWQPINPEKAKESSLNFQLLSIDQDPKMVEISFKERIQFWVDLVKKYGNKPKSDASPTGGSKPTEKTEL